MFPCFPYTNIQINSTQNFLLLNRRWGCQLQYQLFSRLIIAESRTRKSTGLCDEEEKAHTAHREVTRRLEIVFFAKPRNWREILSVQRHCHVGRLKWNLVVTEVPYHIDRSSEPDTRSLVCLQTKAHNFSYEYSYNESQRDALFLRFIW